jgi:purine nucleoside permease
MTVTLDALVVPAFDDLDGLPSEVAPWENQYDLDGTIEVPGVPTPVRHDGRLGIVPTGVGKAAAATTVTALLSSPALGLDEALVCTVGVAGGPPAVPVGSVVVADTVVDWDDKSRLDNGLALNPYTGDRGVFDLDDALVDRARAAAAGVDLNADVDPVDPPGTGNGNGAREPAVYGGVNLCGDELWHGAAVADEVAWLLAERNAGTYRATEMEDAGTAFALSRFGLLDRYLTVRGISNHDRPPGDEEPRESLFDPAFENGFGVAAENAVRVGRAVIEAELDRSA